MQRFNGIELQKKVNWKFLKNGVLLLFKPWKVKKLIEFLSKSSTLQQQMREHETSIKVNK